MDTALHGDKQETRADSTMHDAKFISFHSQHSQHCSLEQPSPCHLIWNGPRHITAVVSIFSISEKKPE